LIFGRLHGVITQKIEPFKLALILVILVKTVLLGSWLQMEAFGVPLSADIVMILQKSMIFSNKVTGLTVSIYILGMLDLAPMVRVVVSGRCV
jgi:hypothetical protein